MPSRGRALRLVRRRPEVLGRGGCSPRPPRARASHLLGGNVRGWGRRSRRPPPGSACVRDLRGRPPRRQRLRGGGPGGGGRGGGGPPPRTGVGGGAPAPPPGRGGSTSWRSPATRASRSPWRHVDRTT